MKILDSLASLKLTFAGMLMLVAAVLYSHYQAWSSPLLLAIPLAILSLNLLSHLLCRRSFRQRPGLLLFHCGLLAVLMLATAGRLYSFQGRIELSAGQAYDAAAVTSLVQGPLHASHWLQRPRFVQDSIRVEYEAGMKRNGTQSRVQPDVEAGQGGTMIFGDNQPLHINGYRFYTTSNKGYAALLRWNGAHGEVALGTVHFPSYPANDWKQINHWGMPGGGTLELEFHPRTVAHEQGAWVLDSEKADGWISVRLPGGESQVLQAGDRLSLANGVLHYVGPRMWMGYEIFFDPTLPWLLLAALISVVGLGWHYWMRFATAPLIAPRGARGAQEGIAIGGV